MPTYSADTSVVFVEDLARAQNQAFGIANNRSTSLDGREGFSGVLGYLTALKHPPLKLADYNALLLFYGIDCRRPDKQERKILGGLERTLAMLNGFIANPTSADANMLYLELSRLRHAYIDSANSDTYFDKSESARVF